MSESENNLAFATKLFLWIKQFSFLMKLRACFYFFDQFFLFFLRKTRKEDSVKKRIAILLLSGMGDGIIFCRLAESLKKALPGNEYELTILCNDSHVKLFSDFFDRVIGFPFYKMSFNPFARIKVLSMLRKEYFDEVWDLNGCGECTPNIFISNTICAAEKKVAYPGLLDCGRKRKSCPGWMKRNIFNEVVELPEDIHILTMFQSFFQHAAGKNIPVQKLSFSMSEPAEIPEQYLLFVPSGSHKRNCWGVQNFAELGKRLYDKQKLPILLCGASGDILECRRLEECLREQGVSVLNLAGKTAFSELVWLLAHAEHVYTIDTGSFHLSVALGTKTTVIAPDAVFSTCVNYPEEYAENLTIIHAGMDCKDCGHNCFDRCSGSYPCVKKILLPGVR